MSQAIKHLCEGAPIREAYGRKRKGSVTSFDVDAGHIFASVIMPHDSRGRTNERYASVKYPMSGPASIRILIREVIRGDWIIGE